MVVDSALDRQGRVMTKLMKSVTALGLILAATSYAAAKDRHHQRYNPTNESFIIQSANGNWAFVTQDHRRDARGSNNAATIQNGNANFAATTQVIANPFSYGRREDGRRENKFGQAKNNSLIYQPGSDNGALVFQAGSGQNNQMTWQQGNGNWAFTAQASSSHVSNSSFTGQFGSNNVAGTFQR